MEAPRTTLSPRELAEAVGVSESSVKRWANDGAVQVVRTVGGHRRIAVEEAIRFVRAAGLTVVRPEVLGLPEVARAAGGEEGAGAEAESLIKALREGDAERSRGLVLAQYLRGRSPAHIIDGPIRLALEELGAEWHRSSLGIFQEHRASEILISALYQLNTLVPEPPAGAPPAVGVAIASDPYVIPTLCVALVLRSCGFRATNLGSNTPAQAIIAASGQLKPRLLWLSISHVEDPVEVYDETLALLEFADSVGAALLVGGREHGSNALPEHPHLYVAGSMSEVAAFVRGYFVANG